MGRARAAHDLALLTAAEEGSDVLLVSEPNKKLSTRGWITDKKKDAAIYFKCNRFAIKDQFDGEGFTGVNCEGLDIYSCYISPNIKIAEYEKIIDGIMKSVRTRGNEALISGDFNAKSPLWGASFNDKRGDILGDWISALDLRIANQGDAPTFVRRGSTSHIDLTIVTQKIGKYLQGWKVLEHETCSDHRYISYEIKNWGTNSLGSNNTRTRYKRVRNRENQIKFVKRLSNDMERVNPAPHKVKNVLANAQKAYLIKVKERDKVEPYWWNEGIGQQRKLCNRCRRTLTRKRVRNGHLQEIEQLIENLKKERKVLRQLINKSKKEHWRLLCEELENDIWGKGYKIVANKLPNRNVSIDQEVQIELVKKLFPLGNNGNQGRRRTFGVRIFSKQEVDDAVEKLKCKKAPGIDRIWPETLKEAYERYPGKFQEMYNRLLRRHEYPSGWREAKILLIPKPGKTDLLSPSTYRPISLINTMGKIYEYLIKKRLREELAEKGPLSSRQFGFQEGKSTIQAVKYVDKYFRVMKKGWGSMVTFDIRNAFNTVRWDKIIDSVRERIGEGYIIEILNNYLQKRTLVLGKNKLSQSMGVPQGSVLGPDLWNIFYDGVLSLQLPAGCVTVAYADDLALLVKDLSRTEMIAKTERCVSLIDLWIRGMRLEMAHEKTEAMVIPRGHRRGEEVVLSTGQNTITTKRAIKYLGIWIDDDLSYRRHIQETTKKAEKSITAIGRILPNIMGPSYHKRRVLVGVAESIVMYGAPIWQSILKVKKYKEELLKLQRKGAVRVISAYRTISTEAALVIAGQVPWDILAEERGKIFVNGESKNNAIKAHARGLSLEAWQRRWDEHDKGRRTHQFIPKIKDWLDCKHRKVDYYLTQFISGHGCNRSYLMRFKIARDERCPYCAERDTPEHAVFSCKNWEVERSKLLLEIKKSTLDWNILNWMREEERVWEKVHNFIRNVIKEKESDERDKE